MHRESLRRIVIFLAAAFWIGCSIEKSPELQTGSIEVRLTDSTGTEILGANIYIDGTETGRQTPATISGIMAGEKELRVWKPGYVPADTSVAVLALDTIQVSLATIMAATGDIELVGAPSGVILLLNGEASGQTPPALVPSIGVGEYRLSAYLPDHTTDLPSLWRVQVLGADTVRVSVNFTASATGDQPGNLVIPFTLPSDWARDFAVQDWRGDVVLVNFWFVACQNCVLEFPYLEQVYEESGGEGGFQILAVDPYDNMQAIQQFRISSGLTFPFLRDAQHSVNQAYEVAIYPTSLLVDKRGIIRNRLGRVTYEELRALVDQLLNE
jgi:cytochrome c biogenesis protein CcmG/thiol:disulfide interchange protein DsbE